MGRTLNIPVGEEHVNITVTPKMVAVRFSLKTKDKREAKHREAQAAAYLEVVWQALRRPEGVVLAPRLATALAGELYKSWSDERKQVEGYYGMVYQPDGSWKREWVEPEEDEAYFESDPINVPVDATLVQMEEAYGPIIDRLLLAQGISRLHETCRPMVLEAFHKARQDAFAARSKQASGDYSPDPKAARFPTWEAGPDNSKSAHTITGLEADWWAEAQASGIKLGTHLLYKRAAEVLAEFLGHDDAARVTPSDILRFKDHRLTAVNAKTAKINLTGLKTVFAWAVANRKLTSNPAAGVNIRLGKAIKLRSKGFTDEEARAILQKCTTYEARAARTRHPIRWVPWLCAYTGARVGEMIQLRQQDLRRDGEHWLIRITPEAGTVKNNEAREVVLHPHLVEMGFPQFVAECTAEYLFLAPAKDTGDVRAPALNVKNRLAQVARSVVSDPNVKPNHGWRHRFKTIGRQAGIDEAILGAIQGQAPASVAEAYGEFTVATIAAAIYKIPRIELEPEAIAA